jgi:hypothetical protein
LHPQLPTLLALLAAGTLLAACADDAPPPATGTIGTASADVSAYDAKAPAPVGSVPNTVTAESQRAVLPPPLPPPESTVATSSTTSGSATDGITYPVTAGFVVGYPNIIEVKIRDSEAAEQVELVAPGGAAAAYPLDETRQVSIPQQHSGIDIGVVATGGSSSHVRTGIGIGFPIFGSAEAPKPVTEVLTRARLRIADLAAYRADWQHWIIRIRFAIGKPNERKMEMAAPQPPAAS